MTTGSPDAYAAVPDVAAGAAPDSAYDGTLRPARPAAPTRPPDATDPADPADPADAAGRSLRSQLEKAHGLPLEQRTVAFETLLEELARPVVLEGPDPALRDYVAQNDVACDDLGRKLIIYTTEDSELNTVIREQFCAARCTFRSSSLEDVFLRLTGRELRE